MVGRGGDRTPRGAVGWAAGAYSLLLFVLLLRPFDFGTPFHSFGWILERNGVEFSSPSALQTVAPPERLYRELASASGMTVEVWVRPKHNPEGVTSRFVSYSGGLSGRRNFTLAQKGPHLRLVLNTTGKLSTLKVADLLAPGDLRHIVTTYQSPNTTVLVDGAVVQRSSDIAGTFSSWDRSYHLVLGNEMLGRRPWRGQLFLVAIYNRALSTQEVLRNYDAGSVFDATSGSLEDRIEEGLVALYVFTAGAGDRVFDRSGRTPPLDLYRPTVLQAFPLNPFRDMKHMSLGKLLMDVIGNVVVFVPFGFLWHTWASRAWQFGLEALIFALLTGALFTLAVELLQLFSATRMSSISDIACNLTGTMLGISVGMLARRSRAESPS